MPLSLIASLPIAPNQNYATITNLTTVTHPFTATAYQTFAITTTFVKYSYVTGGPFSIRYDYNYAHAHGVDCVYTQTKFSASEGQILSGSLSSSNPIDFLVADYGSFMGYLDNYPSCDERSFRLIPPMVLATNVKSYNFSVEIPPGIFGGAFTGTLILILHGGGYDSEAVGNLDVKLSSPRNDLSTLELASVSAQTTTAQITQTLTSVSVASVPSYLFPTLAAVIGGVFLFIWERRIRPAKH